jgi:hypothetical protein
MSTIASVRSTLTHIGMLVAHPAAFVIVGAYVVVWYVVERETLDLHGIATIATWVMTLFIQRAAHRDTQANPCQAGRAGIFSSRRFETTSAILIS